MHMICELIFISVIINFENYNGVKYIIETYSTILCCLYIDTRLLSTHTDENDSMITDDENKH